MTESGNSDVVILDAKPEPINIEPSKTALLVIDMQNDFGSKGGMFDRAGLDISMIQATVQPTSKVLVAARNTGIPIVYLKMGFSPDLSDLGTVDSPIGHGTCVSVLGRDSRHRTVLRVECSFEIRGTPTSCQN
jgi:nicotinamidase-related amidase